LENNLGLINFKAMTKTRRTFTPEERYSIVQEGQREGRSQTCRKYHLSSSLYDKWRKKYLAEGIDGLKSNYKRIDPAFRELEEENERLKRIIAKQALEIEVKTELLKKTPIQTRKR
jgi:putative transposase